jgi:aminoglycoside 6-adenylyltransferase
MRDQLMKMLTWHFGILTAFTQAPGKQGKHFPKVLGPDLWTAVLRSYSDAQPEHIWDALLEMNSVFRQSAGSVAAHFGFEYSQLEDEQVTRFIRHIRTLPGDAKRIYGMVH